MRNKILLLILGIVAVGVVIIGVTGPKEDVVSAPEEGGDIVAEEREGGQTVSSDGISFSYQAGEEGYQLIEPAVDQYGDDSLLKAYVLMSKKEYAALQNGELAGGEAPPIITVFVLDNPAGQDTEPWAREHTLFTNIELAKGTPEAATLDGENGIHYLADGLYALDTFVISHDNKMYVIAGAALDAQSRIVSDFAVLRESISFN